MIVGRSIGPVSGTNFWQCVIAGEDSALDVGSILVTERNNARLLSAVVEVTYVTNVENLESHLASIAAAFGSLSDGKAIGALKSVAVAKCSPIALSGDSARQGVWRASNDVPPLTLVSRASPGQVAEAYGLTSSKSKIGLGLVDGVSSEFGLLPDEFAQHAAIVGATGSGKTHVTARLAAQMAESGEAAVVVMDAHGEYGPLTGALLNSPGVSAENRVLRLGEAVSLRLSDLSPEQAVAFMHELPGPSKAIARDAFTDFVEHARMDRTNWDKDPRWTAKGEFERLDRSIEKTAGTALSRGAVKRAMTRLGSHVAFRGTAPLLRGIDRPGLTIVDTTGADPVSESVVVSALLNKLFFVRRMDPSRRQRVYVVLEEAHRFCDPENPVSRAIAEQFREARKFGVSIVLVTQRLSDLTAAMYANCGTIIALRIGSAEDVALLEARMPDYPSLSRRSLYFGTGHGLFLSRMGRVPFEFQAEAIAQSAALQRAGKMPSRTSRDSYAPVADRVAAPSHRVD